MTSEPLHTCSYSCTRPACVLAQRDELRAKLEDSQDAATFFANPRSADEALMRQALEALEKVVVAFGLGLTLQQNVITALRERLEETK